MKPCPFCGSNDIEILNGYCRCDNCFARGPLAEEPYVDDSGEYDGIAAWNERPEDNICEILRTAWKDGNEEAGDNLKFIAAAFRSGELSFINWDAMKSYANRLKQDQEAAKQ